MPAISHQMRRRDFQKIVLGAWLMGLPRSGRAGALPTVGELNRANNRFAVRFLKEIENSNASENQIVSPFSMECALLMTMEGARGQTAKEMGMALGLSSSLATSVVNHPWDLNFVRSEIQTFLTKLHRTNAQGDQKARNQLEALRAELADSNTKARELVQKGEFQEANALSVKARKLADQVNQLAKSVDQYELSIANGVWAERTHPFEADFSKTIKQYYHASAENVDFLKSAEAERVKINQWISEHTQERIQDLIPAGALNATTKMVLANAIYFQGTWEEPFDASETKPHDFYQQGSTKSQVPMMSKLCENCRYAAFHSDGSDFLTPRTLPEGAAATNGYPKDGVQLAELAYNGGDLSMLLILPTNRDGMSKLIRSLSADRLEQWEKSLAKRKTLVRLPKFKLEANYDLKETLQRHGMKTAFTDEADFSGMSRGGLLISKVLHKAFVEVSEEGTEAAAATTVTVAPTSAVIPRELPFIPEFIADHPFLFLIRNRQTGMILFLGKVERL